MRRCLSLLLLLCSTVPALIPREGQDLDVYAKRRRRMVNEQLAGRDIVDRRVLEVLKRFPGICLFPLRIGIKPMRTIPCPSKRARRIPQP